MGFLVGKELLKGGDYQDPNNPVPNPGMLN
jgi:hypothetical protein